MEKPASGAAGPAARGAGPAVVSDRPGRGRPRRGGAAREEQHEHCSGADHQAAGDIERMMHPRYMRDAATKTGSTKATTQAAKRSRRLGIADVSSSTRPHVHGDRRGGVARRIARVRRQVLEPPDAGRSRGTSSDVTR